MEDNELQHYGIPGMRWGRRKARPMTAYEARVAKAKAAYKAANKQYNRDFSKAYDRSIAAYSPFKKHRQANEERWGAAYDSAAKLKQAKKDYKQAKKDAKADKKRRVEKGKAAIAKAKANYKAAYKQYSKDFNKSSTLLGAWGPGNKERHQKTYESALAANKALKAYKAAKKKYR